MNRPRIVAAVDFSPESELAARQALDLARTRGAELVLLHATAPELLLPPFLATGSLRPETARAIESRRHYAARALDLDHDELAAWHERLSGQGGVVSQSIVEGFADSTLGKAAQELGAELLVLGTHGRTGLGWFFLGSVAERVMRASEIDVLLARRDGAARGGYHRVLVATDFSPSADRALDRAVDLSAPGASIEIVHAYRTAHHPELHDELRSIGGRDLDDVLAAEARGAGDALIAARSGSGRDLAFHLLREAPVPGIVHRLETYPYDLVALGSHGRRGVRRLVLGSVAETVARRAPCSVLIAKTSTAAAEADGGS